VIGLDTNVLVRYVVQDDPQQSELAGCLIETECTPESPGFVSNLVLVELAWVLRGAYDFEKSVVVSVLRQILQTAELMVEEPGLAWAALTEFEQGKADLADCLIGYGNYARGCSRTYTFDRKAAQGRHFELLD
jgi:predicted nucleic-acid-binding protein